jgi:sec-independent protein translocase protein TatA
MPATSFCVLAFGLPGHGEWLILLLLGLLIFGRRLPEVGRSIGRSIVEFKRGIKGIEDEIEDESSRKGEKRFTDQTPAQSLPRRDERAHSAGEPRVPQSQGASHDDES